jgi:glycosyltransferase involved in cell wall biosynthesis
VKVAHVVTRLGRGGTDGNVLHLIDWQYRHGHDPQLVVGENVDPSLVPGWLPVEVVPSLVRQLSPNADVRALRSVRRYLARERPDVVHTHQSKAGIVGRLAALRLVPVTVHTIHMASFGPYYGALSKAFETGERACARFTDLIVSVGEELRELYLGQGVGRPEQYLVVRSPVRLATFLDVRGWSRERRAAERDGLGLTPDASVLLAVGFLERRKRHDLLLRRLRPLLVSGRAVLLVAGEGDQRHSLERLSRELDLTDAVRFLGHVKDVERLLAVADALVHTSGVEGVPQVVVQALAAGVPVVATEMEGLHELPGSVRAVDRPGAGLLRAVEATLARPPPPVPSECLDEWADEAIEVRLAELHRLIEARLPRSAGL